VSGGAVVRPEARVWAAVDLLHHFGRRHAGLDLARQVNVDLDARRVPGELTDQWRLPLAFHAGQTGDTTLAGQLLSPLVSGGTTGQQDAATAILRAISGNQADTRLHIILLTAELSATPASADDHLLRLHQVLAKGTAGWANSTTPSSTPARNSLSPAQSGRQPPRHPGRPQQQRVPDRTVQGRDRGAAPVSGALPDRVRILGPAHANTLTTRRRFRSPSSSVPRRKQSIRARRPLALCARHQPDLLAYPMRRHPAI
jgi:hypothetical protein